MDENLIKQIQTWVNKVPLLVLGSGASVPYGLPTMKELGEHLIENLIFYKTQEISQFNKFKKALETHNDLEKALSNIRLNNNVLRSIINCTWGYIKNRDDYAYKELILKGNEFPSAKLFNHLLNTTNKKISIITTNYDRIAEYSASAAKATICTGFSQNYIGHFSNDLYLNNYNNLKGISGQVNICKVHGSLDWFEKSQNEMAYMPSGNVDINLYKPLIVTPGLSKYSETHNEPYRSIFKQADKEIEQANGYLCIGYGFNDVHVQPKLIEQIKKKPIIVISKFLTDNTKRIILNGDCNNYILMEEYDKNHTKIYSKNHEQQTINNKSLWELTEFLNLIKNA